LLPPLLLGGGELGGGLEGGGDDCAGGEYERPPSERPLLLRPPLLSDEPDGELPELLGGSVWVGAGVLTSRPRVPSRPLPLRAVPPRLTSPLRVPRDSVLLPTSGVLLLPVETREPDGKPLVRPTLSEPLR
jgi:hypothetical protein